MGLWPLSRENHAKFLLEVTLQGRSLIQATQNCLLSLYGPDHHGLAVIARSAHMKSTHEQLLQLSLCNRFCEPDPKDSVAATGLGATILAQGDHDAVIGSFAANHMTSGTEAFLSAISEVVQVTHKGYHTIYTVLVGIFPSHPSTRFYYVRLNNKLGVADAPNAHLVLSFKEKYNERTVSAYIATGSYCWNAGMFVTKAWNCSGNNSRSLRRP
jgi:mannose-1-phosphate guanylyltransferase